MGVAAEIDQSGGALYHGGQRVGDDSVYGEEGCMALRSETPRARSRCPALR
jgi:hypothetical protein